MNKESTQLRFVASINPLLLIEWVNKLPYKIEIKGSPLIKKNKFYLFFIVPDIAKEIIGGDLDG